MRRLFCGLLMTLMAVLFARADADPGSVRFYGINPQYSGINLVFEKYSNFIIPATTPIAVMPIDDEGRFDFEFPISGITYAYVDLGRFRAFIYLEPGMTYEIVLPPFEPKTEAQRLSPHFQPEELLLGIANPEARGLNRNIAEFDATFDYLYNGNAVELFVHSNQKKAKEIQDLLESRFTYDDPVFKRHKELSYLKLWHMTLRRQDRRLIGEYLSDSRVEFELPVYWDVFNTLFTGFLPGRFIPEVRDSLLNALRGRGRFDTIVEIVEQDSLFMHRDLAETVLLYGLYEAFYKKTLSENAVLAITNSGIEHASSDQTRALASELYHKMAMLRPGTKAPGFTLLDVKGKAHSLSDYSGKFVYLNFMHTGNFACLRDLQTLEQFARLFRREMEIVTVIIDDDFEAMENFLNNNKQFKWAFYHFGASPQVLFNYNIQAVPSYFLVDPDGNLSLSPAPGPEENFRELFADRYMNYKREELRRNPPRERSIFRW
jgi:thiol-disulfide isomerase/thioredoxin